MTIGLSRLLLFGSLVAAALLAGAALLSRSKNSLHPISGQPAPRRPDLIARIDTFSVSAGHLGRGEVRQILIRTDGLLLLHSRQWLRLQDRAVLGPFGDGKAGAPGALRDAVDIVSTDSAVFVLDRYSRSMVEYSPAGAYRGRIALPAEPGFVRAEHLESAGPNALFVLAQLSGPDGTIVWRIYERAPAGMRARLTLDSAATGSAPQDLLLRALDSDTLVIGFTLPYRLAQYHGSNPGRAVVRPAPPLFAIPDSARRSYDRMIAPLSPQLRERMRLPDVIAPLRDFARRADGSFIVVRAHGLDRVAVELIAADGTPLAELTAAPVEAPVFPFSGGYIAVRHDADRLTILIHHLDGP